MNLYEAERYAEYYRGEAERRAEKYRLVQAAKRAAPSASMSPAAVKHLCDCPVDGAAMTGTATEKPLGPYFLTHFLVGMSAATLGPTLPGLAVQTGTTLPALSLLFVARALANLGGTVISGYAYDRLAGHRVLATAFILLATATALAGYARHLVTVVILFAGIGLAEGFINVGGNTLTLWANRRHLNASITTLHFFYSFGGFAAPLLVALALYITGSTTSIYRLLPLFLLVPLPLLLLRFSPRPVRQKVGDQQPRAIPWAYLLAVLVLVAVFVGVENSISGWLFTFATGTHVASETGATYLTSLFWAVLSAGRLLAIPLARRLSPHRILSLTLCGMVIGGLVVTIGGSYRLVAVGIVWLGLCMAPVFPTVFALTGERVAMTGRMTSAFFVSGAVGAMLLPCLVGVAIGWFGAAAIMWIITGGILVIIMAYWASHRLSQQLVSSLQIKGATHA